MRRPIKISVPFIAPAGSHGTAHLILDDSAVDTALLRIDVGHALNGSIASAPLNVSGMRKLVDGLMDCIFALERDARASQDGREWNEVPQ